MECGLFCIAAGGRGVRHGTQLRDPGCSEHQTHAGAARPLPAQLTGTCLHFLFAIVAVLENSMFQ